MIDIREPKRSPFASENAERTATSVVPLMLLMRGEVGTGSDEMLD